MKIGIIDADLIWKKRHRFPNLASMKISGYYKKMGHEVELKLDYNNLDQYDKVFISKVFADTQIDEEILKLDNVEYGGTGFFYDKAPDLPYEIEHHMPDYHLYDNWVESQIEKGIKVKEFDYYINYSIGYTTRKCFRQCGFCVNKNYKKVEVHSPVNEFLDPSRKYICLLDDNILGSSEWREIFEELNNTGKRFQYKQGMDERILTPERCEVILNSKYIGDYIFAFDDIDDKHIIERKLEMWSRKKKILSNKKTTKFYVLCGFDKNNKYDEEFWIQDIVDAFERIKLLMKYGAVPYIMRYEKWEESPYRGTYVNLSRWCNQPSFYKKKSYREFCQANQDRTKSGISAPMKYLNELEEKCPDIASKYFDMKFEELKSN